MQSDHPHGRMLRPTADHLHDAPPSRFGTGAGASTPPKTADMRARIAARLAAAGIAHEVLAAAAGAAVRHGTCFTEELVAAGHASEADIGRAIAGELDAVFDAAVDHERVLLRKQDVPAALRSARRVMLQGPAGALMLYVAPRLSEIAMLKAHLARDQGMRDRLRVCTHSALADALRSRHEAAMVKRAVAAVETVAPVLSARHVATAWQGVAIGVMAVALPAAFWMRPEASMLALHLFASLFFFGCVLIRLLAVSAARPGDIAPLRPLSPDRLPRYTVLVPLRDEGRVVPQLVAALDRLHWPRAKLDVRLVCEEDDAGTLAALSAWQLPPSFAVVTVPGFGPRTKPKALNFGLQSALGDYVVVYDAEDRPHPDQLIEAWQRFQEEGDDLACVQAPLLIGNFRANAFARLFAFEYAALFRGLLPWLSRRGHVVPLGGTSNHFRRTALEAVGSWDPHNVTEDADLGLRLSRRGYRITTITRGTVEDAPTNLAVWLRQRTRWYKGWMQTLLVHWREPAVLLRDLGPRRFVTSQVLMIGNVFSALVHPLIVFMVFAILWRWLGAAPQGPLDLALMLLDTMNITAAYLFFYVLGARSLSRSEARAGPVLAWIPVYWLMLSAAAWRAAWQLFWKPHLWEKTPHWPAGPAGMQPQSRNEGPEPMILPSSSPIAAMSRPS
jgi:cellulose synthase/poly-beta-1,6-N-acetylglucosamine synthase-like glycosyltransferase